ncbi:hypothetical protein B0H17DRAFT_1135562 [Mycena rosella]|uniref:Uncharacterized protein n=1 Tax=Mycena rosella TaxID=1033263 RepID=A0AAD7GCU9_MYCRO|nr:hypothetical protein B0H17DRAFT_1135562 [Mycena rosella]
MDFPEAGAVVCLTKAFQEGDPLLSLVRPEGGWSIETATHAIIGRDSIFDTDSTTLSARVPASRASHSKFSKGCKTKCGYRPPAQKIECVFARECFNHLHFFDAFGYVGQHHLYYSQPRARVLHPYISKFYLVYYGIKEDISLERSTFFVDRNGQIFMFRSFRAQWLMDHVEEVEVTHDILVGDDSSSDTICNLCHNGLCGAHMPTIIETVVQVIGFRTLSRSYFRGLHTNSSKMRSGTKSAMASILSLDYSGICALMPGSTIKGVSTVARMQTRKPGWNMLAADIHTEMWHQQMWLVIWEAGVAVHLNQTMRPSCLMSMHCWFIIFIGGWVNPLGLLSAEVIALQKQISLNATSHVAEPVAGTINGEPTVTNCKPAHCEHQVIDETMRNSVVVREFGTTTNSLCIVRGGQAVYEFQVHGHGCAVMKIFRMDVARKVGNQGIVFVMGCGMQLTHILPPFLPTNLWLATSRSAATDSEKKTRRKQLGNDSGRAESRGEIRRDQIDRHSHMNLNANQELQVDLEAEVNWQLQ